MFEPKTNQPVKQNGDNAGQQRAENPSADNLGKNAVVGFFSAVKVPADDRANDGLRGGNGNAAVDHPVNGEGCGAGAHKRTGNGIDGTQFNQSGAGAAAGKNGAQHDEYGGNDGRGTETNHFGADGSAENVGGVVGTQ